MKSPRRQQGLRTTFALLALLGCDSAPKQSNPQLFSSQIPANTAFVEELRYIESTAKLSKNGRELIENELSVVEQTLGVPKALLWCVLFQESRFDTFKNALNRTPAKGLGQFTSSALYEINHSTNEFDSRTRSILTSHLNPKLFPIQLKLKARKNHRWPKQSVHSYYHTPTAIFASGAYLNNRYQELKSALDHQGIHYDPQVLWLYAAAAYNKGSRTVFVLLTHEYMAHGDAALANLVNNPHATYQLLTHSSRLEYAVREIWKEKTRTKYIEELLRNMEVITSCAVSEHKL